MILPRLLALAVLASSPTASRYVTLVSHSLSSPTASSPTASSPTAHSLPASGNPLLTSAAPRKMLTTGAVVPGSYTSFYSGLQKGLQESAFPSNPLARDFQNVHNWAGDRAKDVEASEVLDRVQLDVVGVAHEQVAGWRCTADSCDAALGEQTNNSWLIRDFARWGRANEKTRSQVQEQLAELGAMFASTKDDLNETIKALAAEGGGAGGPRVALRGGVATRASNAATASHYNFLKRFILLSSRLLGVGLDSVEEETGRFNAPGAALSTNNVLPLSPAQYEREAIFAYWKHIRVRKNASPVERMMSNIFKAMLAGDESGLTPMVETYFF